jgi:hypothetical protein
MKSRTAILVLALCGCSPWGHPELDELPVVQQGSHFDLATSVAGAQEMLAWADEAYEMFAELLEVRPGRAKLVILPDQETFDRAVGPHGRGSDGVYRACPDPIIVTMPRETPFVIRHEVAHHFIREALGDLPLWMNEGLAEILEGARRVGGIVQVPVVDVGHLDRYLDQGCISVLPTPENARHVHVDYSASWAAMAAAVARERGAFSSRIHALHRQFKERPEVPMPRPEELLEAARLWTADIILELDNPDQAVRGAAARILGKLGEAEPLNRACSKPQPVPVAAALSGALARTGDRSRLRAFVPQICCENVLHQVSLAVGREFRSVAELKAWLADE